MSTTLTETIKLRVDSESEAIDLINKERAEYTVSHASYAYKTKKKNGEIVADGYLVTITREYEGFWAEYEEEQK